jgi:hypothetical protein
MLRLFLEFSPRSLPDERSDIVGVRIQPATAATNSAQSKFVRLLTIKV